jgi:endonuclease-3
MDKRPFDIDVALARIEDAVRPWPKAALFQLAEEGFSSTFEQLLACIISIRTYDEVTLPVSRTLFARARTPSAVMELSWKELDALISPSTFHERKANQILAIARQVHPWRRVSRYSPSPKANISQVLEVPQ